MQIKQRKEFSAKDFAPTVYMTGPLATTFEPSVYENLKEDEPFNLVKTVDDGINGFLCEPRSTASLVSQLERIITMGHDNRIAMGEKSRQKIEREFDERIIIGKYLEAINVLLSK